jgi:RNA polymerase sigma-70 factor (ECF subfamily)
MVSHSPPDIEGRFYDALIHDENDAWSQLRYMCYPSARKYINNAPEREDVIQTAVIKIWRNIKSYDVKQSFKTWINTIVERTAIDALRKK